MFYYLASSFASQETRLFKRYKRYNTLAQNQRVYVWRNVSRDIDRENSSKAFNFMPEIDLGHSLNWNSMIRYFFSFHGFKCLKTNDTVVGIVTDAAPRRP